MVSRTCLLVRVCIHTVLSAFYLIDCEFDFIFVQTPWSYLKTVPHLLINHTLFFTEKMKDKSLIASYVWRNGIDFSTYSATRNFGEKCVSSVFASPSLSIRNSHIHNYQCSCAVTKGENDKKFESKSVHVCVCVCADQCPCVFCCSLWKTLCYWWDKFTLHYHIPLLPPLVPCHSLSIHLSLLCLLLSFPAVFTITLSKLYTIKP